MSTVETALTINSLQVCVMEDIVNTPLVILASMKLIYRPHDNDIKQ